MVELTQIDILILVTSAFFTSMLSAILGMAGGAALLAVMMQYLPQGLLIPVHGIVQMASNGFRAGLNLKHIEKRIYVPLLIGGVFGAAVGSQFVLKIPQHIYAPLLATMILVFTWKPKSKRGYSRFRFKFYFLGFISYMASLLFGATGPLLAPFFLNENLTRFQIIATKAATQFTAHVIKTFIYVAVGVSLGAHIDLIVYMVVAVFAGTFVGNKLLNKVPEQLFIWLFKGIITLLCLRMLVKAFI